jgi:outer membrane protein OmpA-like peptidoglycan-associated protein
MQTMEDAPDEMLDGVSDSKRRKLDSSAVADPQRKSNLNLWDILDVDTMELILLSSGTGDLGNFMCTCTHMRQSLTDVPFLRRLALSRGFDLERPAEAVGIHTQFGLSADFVDSLQGLAVLESMNSIQENEDQGKNHIVFHLATLRMTNSSEALLAVYASLMKAHPRLELRIDSHTGVGAPASMHASHSVRRASVVADFLTEENGIASERISACAWGYRLGQMRRWPGMPEYARAEVYVCLPPAAQPIEKGIVGQDDSGDTPAALSVTASMEGDMFDGADGDEAAPQRTDTFDCSRCLPVFPSYYESVTPVKAFFTFDGDGAEPNVEHEEDSEDEGDGGADFMRHLQTLGPAARVQLPGGRLVSVGAFLAMLRQGNGDSDEEMDGDGDIAVVDADDADADGDDV